MKSVSLILPLLFFAFSATAQDSLEWQGQFSAFLNYNKPNDLPVLIGARFIPGVNYRINTGVDRKFDFEGSLHINGTAGIHLFDSARTDGVIKPYRLWGRYSTNQLEIRAGLQKINFGSATLLRPLMWFDQIDPRDPLQLTDGVWGLLARYYFLNNASIWLWGLWGNEKAKTWETSGTSQKFPELGGRFQSPVASGEMAVSYHFRKALTDTAFSSDRTETGENRVGIDGKWDLGFGLWFEASWTGKNYKEGNLTNQELLTLGADYTFGIGNGINLVIEHLLISYDEKAFAFMSPHSFSGMTLSYPAGIADNVSSILFIDWTNSDLYTFLNWKHQFNKSALYLMMYWNPRHFAMPQQKGNSQVFAGKGIQLMYVYNY